MMYGAGMPASTPPVPRVQCNVRLPAPLVAALDSRRAITGQSRDAWVARALQYVLDTTTPPQEGTTP